LEDADVPLHSLSDQTENVTVAHQSLFFKHKAQNVLLWFD